MTSENLPDDTRWHKFDCCDCGIHVVSFLPEPAGCCAICKWLRDIPDPISRARLRGHLANGGSIGGGNNEGRP